MVAALLLYVTHRHFKCRNSRSCVCVAPQSLVDSVTEKGHVRSLIDSDAIHPLALVVSRGK